MKKFVSLLLTLITVTAITLTVAACSWTTEEKTAAGQQIKSALAQAGTLAYSLYGRDKLESWLNEKVADGTLIEAQKEEALTAADKGVSELTAYLKTVASASSVSSNDTSSTDSKTASETETAN